jgi:hypothetical protein
MSPKQAWRQFSYCLVAYYGMSFCVRSVSIISVKYLSWVVPSKVWIEFGTSGCPLVPPSSCLRRLSIHVEENSPIRHLRIKPGDTRGALCSAALKIFGQKPRHTSVGIRHEARQHPPYNGRSINTYRKEQLTGTALESACITSECRVLGMNPDCAVVNPFTVTSVVSKLLTRNNCSVGGHDAT